MGSGEGAMKSSRHSKSGARIGPTRLDERIRRAQALMCRTIDRKLTLRDLAREAGISVSRFCHLFKGQTGTAPGRYLRRLRLSEAARLLRETPLSVKQVAGNLAYQDASRFVAAFRKVYRVTPLQYRRRARQPRRRPQRPGRNSKMGI